ncbi:hypothetical protein Q6375_00210 [Clostridium septicum]|uniref:hypothetical protein n=1 Tax=Clostridium septicum TaxID=1504 RepID=UPI00272E2ECF|nr:hypothetical protein [Clostridium septicum]WLF69489.1 hypothetical protein Q6375_00210 [Clostridium septicum]
MSNKKNRNKEKKNRNKAKEDVSKTSAIKDKIILSVLIGEIFVAIGMLVLMFSADKSMMVASGKLAWIIYLVIQVVLGFTVLNYKKDKNKGIYHWETVLITITYLVLP